MSSSCIEVSAFIQKFYGNWLNVYTHVKYFGFIVLTNSLIMIEINDIRA